MRFLDRYDVSLRELLLSPLVFRHGAPELDGLPDVSAALLHDLAAKWGHRPNAIRTALSRLRAEGHIISGRTGLKLGSLGKSITRSVRATPAAARGVVVAVFSFATEDARQRHVVREALRLHGFHKLAQNVYVSRAADTRALEELLERRRVLKQVFLFRCENPDDERLAHVFGVDEHARRLSGFSRALDSFLRGASGDDFARRFLAAAPAHYRLSFVDAPPLPATPEFRRLAQFGRLNAKQAKALRRYFLSFASAALAAHTPHMP